MPEATPTSWKLGGRVSHSAPQDHTEYLRDRSGQTSFFGRMKDNYLIFLNDHDEFAHLFFGAIWLLLGVVLFQAITACLILTAFFLIVQILTTIGYGDVVPVTNPGKYMTSFYALGTIIFLGSCFNVLLNAIAERMEAVAEQAQKAQLAKSVPGVETEPEHHQHALKRLFGVWSDTIIELTSFSVLVAFGTIFYATYEACTCSYGVTFIDGCSDTSYQVCAATGGSLKTWLDSFYMVVITLTTIGFGDYTPQSYLGRLVFIPWALLGVVSMGRFATTFGASLSRAFSLPVQKKTTADIRRDLKSFLGKDASGKERDCLSFPEFAHFLLYENNIVKEYDENVANAAFEEVDWLREGVAGFDDTIEYVKGHLEAFKEADDS